MPEGVKLEKKLTSMMLLPLYGLRFSINHSKPFPRPVTRQAGIRAYTTYVEPSPAACSISHSHKSLVRWIPECNVSFSNIDHTKFFPSPVTGQAGICAYITSVKPGQAASFYLSVPHPYKPLVRWIPQRNLLSSIDHSESFPSPVMRQGGICAYITPVNPGSFRRHPHESLVGGTP